MYTGSESLINEGAYLNYSVLDFWRWATPDFTDSTVRGTFADFIVKTALESNGFTGNQVLAGWEPYDLDGPNIPVLNRPARIEVKCTGFVQKWGAKHPDRASFSIRPAKVLDAATQDYLRDSPRQRNNDLYVFCVYTAKDKRANILDLTWWEFYVLPTQTIESDNRLRKQKTISLVKVKELCGEPLTYNQLCPKIVEVCNGITSDEVERFYPEDSKATPQQDI